MTQKLGAQAAIEKLSGWSADAGGRDAIMKTYRFEDFSAAFAFMTRVGMMAERMDHHPEWFNVYDRVDVVLATHDAGGVTDKDVALARYMDSIAG